MVYFFNSSANTSRVACLGGVAVLCMFLSACGTGVKKSKWDDVRYRDLDSSYIPPVSSCMDDAPNCQ